MGGFQHHGPKNYHLADMLPRLVRLGEGQSLVAKMEGADGMRYMFDSGYMSDEVHLQMLWGEALDTFYPHMVAPSFLAMVFASFEHLVEDQEVVLGGEVG